METLLRLSPESGSENGLCPDMLSFVRYVWLPIIQRTKHSWRVDDRISRQHILPFFGARRLCDISGDIIRDWLAGFDQKNFAISTRNRILCVLKDIFKTASENGYVGFSPASHIHCSPEKRPDVPILKEEQIDALLNRLKTSQRLEARAIGLLALTSASKNEILSARWENFDRDRKLLVVESQAGKKRNLWLSTEAMEIIDAIPKSRSPWFFPGRDKNRHFTQIFPFWNQVRHECGLDFLRIQDLKYACCAHSPEKMLNAIGSARAIPFACQGDANPADKFHSSGVKRSSAAMPIAIIGIGMRFPGNINSPDAMWNALMNRECLIRKIPENRWPVEGLSHPSRSEPGRSVTFAAGVLENIDGFDAGFFRISPREASWMDPQQRILLEVAHEAMEDAGLVPENLAGANCGVYVGISGMDYGQHALEDLASMSAHTMTGNTLSIAANRLSYFYDLRGPSIAMDTACSSALAAIHHACMSLRNGETAIALAGGINLLMHPYSFIGFSHASMLSAKGQCRPFDASGDGYVRGEGGALLLLKPLDKALADGDHIHAVILGSGVNSDGSRKTGLTIPSAAAQAELMRDVLRSSGLEGQDVDFVEAHGTGTPVGDPAEAGSIGAAYGKNRQKPLPISSAKGNFGHLEPASGMVGLIKAILSLRHAHIPPMPFDFEPNPKIDFAGLNIVCAANGQDLEPKDRLVAGVNSFGFGGLNAHVLLGSFTGQNSRKDAPDLVPPLFLSAVDESALKELALRYADALEKIPDDQYYDFAWSAANLRSRLAKRLAVLPEGRLAAAESLRAWARGSATKNVVAENSLAEPGGVAFVYSGNGAQWHGMGRQLYEESPEFAEIIDFLDTRMQPVFGCSISEKLLRGEADILKDTAVSQPLLFVVQIALTMLLEKMGLKPDAVAGHSVGEVAAAWASGALSLDQATRVIHARSYSQSKTRGLGRMAAVALSASDASRLIKELNLSGRLEVAAANSPGNATISGEAEALRLFEENVRGKNIFFRDLGLDYAFHSRHMETAREDLDNLIEGLVPENLKKAVFVSTVTGGEIDGKNLDRSYWWRNMRDPVRFSAAIQSLADLGIRVFVEIGPHAVLQRYMRETLGKRQARVMPSLQQGNPGLARVRSLAASLFLLGNEAAPAAIFPEKGAKMPLPFYPWQKQSCWYKRTSEVLPEPRRQYPLLGWELPGVDPVWENILDPRKDKWLLDHKVGGVIVLAAAAYVELALEAARAWRGNERLSLENFDIFLPLVFEPDRAQTVRCSINTADGLLRILSRPRLDNGKWTEHARCRIIAASGERKAQEWNDSGLEAFTAERLYELTSSLGLDYGPEFRRIESLARGQDRLSALLQNRAANDYLLDPSALDACFHSITALYVNKDENSAWLPVGADRIECLAPGAVESLRSFIRKTGDRLIHADFEMFNKAGELAAVALGCRFRKMPAQNKAEKVDSWTSRAWLEPLPENRTSLPDTRKLARAMEDMLKSHTGERNLWDKEILPRLEALTLAGIAELFPAIPPEDTPYYNWMRNLLRAENLVDEAGKIVESDLPSWRDLWLETWKMAPEFLPALLPAARTLERLPRLFAHEISSTQLLEQLKTDAITDGKNWPNPAWMGADQLVAAVLREIVGQRRQDAKTWILDLGACLSTLPVELSNEFPADALACIQVCKDAQPRSMREKIRAEYPDWGFFQADPNIWLTENHDFADKFDVIILRQTLHQSKNLEKSVQAAKKLLKSGGIILLSESFADWSEDLINGLDPDWWHMDAANNPISSRMPPKAWEKLLADNGFANFVIKGSGGESEGAWVMLAEKCASEEDRENMAAGSWLILADVTGLSFAEALARDLRGKGRTVEINSGDWKVSDAPGVIITAWDEAPANAAATLDKINQFLSQCDKLNHPPQLWLVTKGGALAEVSPEYRANPVQGALTGFGRVIGNEYPALGVVSVDIDPDLGQEEAAGLLARELERPESGCEIALTRNGRRQIRILPSSLKQTLRPDRCRLEISQPGRIDNLRWVPMAETSLGENEVEARVMAVGLNFRDIMFSMGLLPEDALENGFAGASLGLEFSGIVTRAGKNANGFKAGDRVAGFAPACFASHVLTPASALAKIPADLDFARAAASPTVFITAWYALKYLARTAPGEIVLVHGGAGGVGLAAIQIAKKLGARVFATAGTPEKRDLLYLLGAEAVFDSRGLFFADEIMAATNGSGVDVALNSLAGEAMRRTMGLLRPFGRFLELGKRDYVENTSVGLKPLKENISYFSIDVDQLLTARPRLAMELFEEVEKLLENHEFAPPPYRVFAASQVKDAFRTMQQSRHIGKIVVDMAVLPKIAAIPEIAPDYNGTWLVSGGTSGFGLETARHLARRGVKNLALVSRRGGNIPNSRELVEEFSRMGSRIELLACDIVNKNEVDKLIADIRENMPPLKGIVHAAAVFNDQLLKNMDRNQLQKTLDTKLLGAWNLHEATRASELKHFVLYSSISVALGNPGQGNYVAANAGLEALANMRIREGLPATVIAWGPVSDAGYLTRHEGVGKSLGARLGREPMNAALAMEQFDAAVAQNGVFILANVDWDNALSFFNHVPARLAFLASDNGDGQKAAARSGALNLEGMDIEEACAALCGCIIDEAAKVLGLDSSLITPERNLQSLGLDSLMAMELAMGIEQRAGVRLPPMLMQDAPTVEQLARRIAARLTAGEAAGEDGQLLESIVRRHSETLAPEEMRDVLASVEDVRK